MPKVALRAAVLRPKVVLEAKLPPVAIAAIPNVVGVGVGVAAAVVVERVVTVVVQAVGMRVVAKRVLRRRLATVNVPAVKALGKVARVAKKNKRAVKPPKP